MDERLGNYSFAVGVVIALVLGLAASAFTASVQAVLTAILVLLGIVVGIVNITGEETKDFLFTATVLIIATALGLSDVALRSVGAIGGVSIGTLLVGVFGKILIFTVPAVIIVALKHIWYLASTR